MKHLTLEQRYEIQTILRIDKKQSGIALHIGKSKSAVCRELKRNTNVAGYYNAQDAIETSRRRERIKNGEKAKTKNLNNA